MSKFNANERVHLDTDLYTVYADGSPVAFYTERDEHMVSYDVNELNQDKVIVATFKGRASHEVIESLKQTIREELRLDEDFPVLVQDDSLSIEFRDLKNEQQISNELFELKEAVCSLIEQQRKMQHEIRIINHSLLDSDVNPEEIAKKLKEMQEKEKRFRPPTL